MPTWWPIPVRVLAGLPVAFAIVKLPGNGGHVPAHGLQVGCTQPAEVPGIAARGRYRLSTTTTRPVLSVTSTLALSSA